MSDIAEFVLRGVSGAFSFCQAAYITHQQVKGKSTARGKVELAGHITCVVGQTLGMVMDGTALNGNQLIDDDSTSLAVDIAARSSVVLGGVVKSAANPKLNKKEIGLSGVVSSVSAALSVTEDVPSMEAHKEALEITNLTLGNVGAVALVVMSLKKEDKHLEAASQGDKAENQQHEGGSEGTLPIINRTESSLMQKLENSKSDSAISVTDLDLIDSERTGPSSDEEVCIVVSTGEESPRSSEASVVDEVKISEEDYAKDKELSKYICPITKKVIRYIVKLKEGKKEILGLRYEREAIEKWLQEHIDAGPQLLPGYDQLVDLRSVRVCKDSYSQGRIELRRETLGFV